MNGTASADRGRCESPRGGGSVESPHPQSSSPGLLRNQIHTRSRVDVNGNTRLEIVPIEQELAFDKGLYMFIRAVQKLRQGYDGIIVVGLAGPSGAGKTVFSTKVRSFLPGTCHLQMDMYNDGTKVVDNNFDDPRLTDYDTLLANIADLRAGKTVQVPIYDFRQSKRTGYTTVEPPESRVVVVEGIYALSSRLRDLMDMRVSIKGGIHFDLVKRVLRDIDRSGQQPEEILQQISSTVYPMYKVHIEPDLETAHLRVVNSFNPFSGLQNATYTLKSSKPVTEQACMEYMQSQDPETTRRLDDITDIYLLPPNEDPETCQTWLRMRSRDGKYSLMFEEFVTDDPFIISPRVSFEVSVRVMGGLMALGYKMKVVMRRSSIVFTNAIFTVKIDTLEGLDGVFVQVQGKSRELVAEAGSALGLDGTYTPHSFIEQVQLSHLMSEFKEATSEFQDALSLDVNTTALPEALRNGGVYTEPRKSSPMRPHTLGHRRSQSRGSPERSHSTPDLVLHTASNRPPSGPQHPRHSYCGDGDLTPRRRHSNALSSQSNFAPAAAYEGGALPEDGERLARQLNDVLIRNAEVDHKLDSLLSTVAALLKHYTPPPEPAPARSGGLASSDFHTGLLTASLTSAAICMSAACAAFVLDKLRR